MGIWQFWMAGPGVLLGSSERNWIRAKARAEWLRIRTEHRDKVRGYMFVSKLVSKGLATREELDDLGRDVARLNTEVERAATAYRATAVCPNPLRRPLQPLNLAAETHTRGTRSRPRTLGPLGPLD